MGGLAAHLGEDCSLLCCLGALSVCSCMVCPKGLTDGKPVPVQPRGASKYKHFPSVKLCLIHLIKSSVGSITAIVFSGANSFPLIRNLLTSLLANLVQTAPWAVKSNGKCGLRWHSQSLSWKGVTGEVRR